MNIADLLKLRKQILDLAEISLEIRRIQFDSEEHLSEYLHEMLNCTRYAIETAERQLIIIDRLVTDNYLEEG